MPGTSSAASRGDAIVWLASALLVVVGIGLLAARSDPSGLGAVVAAVNAGWVAVGWFVWRRDDARRPVPAAEYVAAV